MGIIKGGPNEDIDQDREGNHTENIRNDEFIINGNDEIDNLHQTLGYTGN